MTKRQLRLCLIMHSTRSDNLGVGALTVSQIEILRGLARNLGHAVEITVMDWKDPRDPYVEGSDLRLIELDGRVMLNPFGYFATALRSDIVLDIGGGDSFADIYGSRRLTRMFILKFLTHLSGTPLVVAPQTIGPFTKPLSQRLARWSLKLSKILATRDAKSTAAVAELGVTRPVIEASDVALRLPYQAAVQPPGKPRVGINVSGLLMGGGYTGKNEFGISLDYPTLVRDLIRHFQALGCEVHMVPHVIVASGPMVGEDDARASAALVAEFPGTVLAPSFRSPSEAKSYISGMDFFMGARMHACIAAFSSGVPVIPMAYSRKFAGLFGSLGYDRTVDCTSEDGATILTKIAAAYDDRALLRDEAKMALKQGYARLSRYEAAVQELMHDIIRRKRL